MASTFVYCSSYWSEKPITSNAAAGAWVSSENSGIPERRISASASGHGANVSSAAQSSRWFSTWWMIRIPTFESPIS